MSSPLFSKRQNDPNWDADSYDFFGFQPSAAAAIVWIVCFALAGLLHCGLTFKSKFHWGWLVPVGCVCEIVGHVGRLIGHYNPYGLSAYLLQQVLTVIAPVFFSAMSYAIFCKLVPKAGREHSRLRPRTLVIYLVTVDIISLVLQGVGGGKSGAAGDSGNDQELETGRNIYLAGISFQLANTIVFTYLVFEYFYRISKSVGSIRSYGGSPLLLTLVGLMLTNVLIVLRNCFREAELSEGFQGHLATTEIFFSLLDALPMFACTLALALCHPCFGLNRLNIALPIEDEKRLTATRSESA